MPGRQRTNVLSHFASRPRTLPPSRHLALTSTRAYFPVDGDSLSSPGSGRPPRPTEQPEPLPHVSPHPLSSTPRYLAALTRAHIPVDAQTVSTGPNPPLVIRSTLGVQSTHEHTQTTHAPVRPHPPRPGPSHRPGIVSRGGEGRPRRGTPVAKSQLYGPGLWYEAPEGRTWYGAYRTFPDTYAYCIDAGKQSPLPENFTDAKAQTVTAPQTAWALSKYSDSDSADVQAALSAIARADKRIDHDHTVPPQEPDELGKKFAGAAKKYAQITAEAKRFAGPYTLSVDLEPVLDMPKLEPYDAKPDDGKELSLPTTNTVTLTVSLTSASDTEVPDVPITLTITGADGPTSVTSGEKPATAKLTASQPGTVAVSAERVSPRPRSSSSHRLRGPECSGSSRPMSPRRSPIPPRLTSPPNRV